MAQLYYRNNSGILVATNLTGVARGNGGTALDFAGSSGGPPTFVATYKVSSFTTTSTPKTVSITVSAGDVLVVGIVGSMDTATFNAPTGVTGATWVKKQDQQTTDTGIVGVYTTTVPTGGTYTLSVARPGAAMWGFICYRFSGSSGIGATSKGAVTAAAPSLSLTTNAANSAIVYFGNDWWIQPIGSRVWRTINSITPTSGNGLEQHAVLYADEYTFYSAYWNDAGAAGAKTTGLSAPGNQGSGMVAVEVLGS